MHPFSNFPFRHISHSPCLYTYRVLQWTNATTPMQFYTLNNSKLCLDVDLPTMTIIPCLLQSLQLLQFIAVRALFELIILFDTVIIVLYYLRHIMTGA